MSDSEEPEYVAGTGVEISSDSTGYTAEQIDEQNDGDTLTVPPPDDPETQTFSLEWSHGPVSYEGWFDHITLDMKVLLILSGVKVGVFRANAKDNFKLNVKLYKTIGTIMIYLYMGNGSPELKTNLSLGSSSGTTYNGDFKHFAW